VAESLQRLHKRMVDFQMENYRQTYLTMDVSIYQSSSSLLCINRYSRHLKIFFWQKKKMRGYFTNKIFVVMQKPYANFRSTHSRNEN